MVFFDNDFHMLPKLSEMLDFHSLSPTMGTLSYCYFYALPVEISGTIEIISLARSFLLSFGSFFQLEILISFRLFTEEYLFWASI